MGRKLNLSHLSDGECRQILDVVQRDFRLRQREKERIGKLKKKVDEEEEKRSVLSRQQAFNQKHCMRCFSAFGLVFNKRGQCVVCHYFFCKDCRICVNSFMWICKGCILERQFQSQAFEWYYDKIKDRFRRYGSAKVVRSLYKRKSNECFESPSDQSNTDSGFEHQLSPNCRNNRCSIALEDKSTNTDKDFLESMRPDMENVSTQWPPASRRNSYRSESLSPDTETWQNIRLDPNVYKNNTNEISVEVFCEKMPTSPISKVITQHERFSSGIQPAVDPTVTHLKSLSPIPEMSSPECIDDNVLSEIGESGAEEKDFGRERYHCARNRGILGKINGSPLRLIKRGYPKCNSEDIDIQMIEENAKHSDQEPELETSDILGARCSKQIRLEDAQADSIDSVSDVSLPSMGDTEVDSLETQYLSAHSNLTTPDVENDSNPSTPSTPVPGMLSLGKNNSHTFWDDITLPHSSSSETLKSDQGEESHESQFFSTEEFLDEISNRSPTSKTPCSSEEELHQKLSDTKSRHGSEDRMSPSSYISSKSYSTEYHTAQSELDSRVTSPLSAKTTSSSEYFTAFSEFSETKEDEQNNNTRDSDDNLSCSSHGSLSGNSEVGGSKTNLSQSGVNDSDTKNSSASAQAVEEASVASVYARDSFDDDEDDEETPNNSPTNKLIRYDSLSLVVEVSEDDGELPNPPLPAYHMPRFCADYDSGHDSYSSESSVDHNRRRALRHYFRNDVRLSPSSEEDPHSRQASFDSVDSYSHKSASLSSRQASTESTRTSDAGLSRKGSPDVENPVNTEFSSEIDAHIRNTEISGESVQQESDRMCQKMNISEPNDTLNGEEDSNSMMEAQDSDTDLQETSDLIKQCAEHSDGNGVVSKPVDSMSDSQNIGGEDTCLNDPTSLQNGLTPHEDSTQEEAIKNLIKTVPSIVNTAAILLQSPPEKRKMLSTKAELDLTNLSKKVLMRRDEVLESAEEMLSSANQMSNISDQMEVLEQCLSSLEKTLVGDSESDEDDCKQNGGNLSPQDQVVEDVQKLEQKLQVHDHCLGMETEQTAAIAVRMITNTALKVLATTENVIETEHAQFASGDVKTHSTGKPVLANESLSSDAVLDLIDLKETSVDSVQELLPITNVNEMPNGMQHMPNSSVETLGEDAEMAHVCNTQNDLAVKPSSVEENGNCFVNDQSIHVTSSHNTSTNLISSSLKTGARRKDSVSGCRKKMKGTIEDQCDIEHIDEVADEIIHLEEKVYLSASHVFSLEDKLSKLENQVRGLDITASEELIGGLEDELALTLAQVAHSENQVCSAEDRIDQLKSRTGFVQGEEKEDRFNNFIKNISGSSKPFYAATANKPVSGRCESTRRSEVPDFAGTSFTDRHQNPRSELPNGSADSLNDTFEHSSSLPVDEVDGEYALESDEDEIFLVASSSLQTDLYQKSSYGTFTRSVSQPDVSTDGSRQECSFDDKRSVSVTDVNCEMPGLCSFLDDSNLQFQPYSSSSGEFSDDSQRISPGSDDSQRNNGSDNIERDIGGRDDNQRDINGSDDRPQNTVDTMSYNVNEDPTVRAACENTPKDNNTVEGSQNSVSALVYASEANFNSPVDQGHTDSRTQRHDSQFQNDLLINSTYVGSKTEHYMKHRPDKVQICTHLGN
ncbi:uncharacterized protein LOC117104903 isoform X2 [Anneissia japonica]|uniref:uncharacterized protein LOC117104903 isoform X2 n=1 Tax=Anneissia japonica TaxID=1529436 RepID=UPI00142591D4|nr:uncharacterized protein LOC117104903 isoform X2 [Anneissia japonica]